MRVLLCDDEPELIFTLAERLELRGYDVDAVTSGTEALQHIEQNDYDVAVVDLKMPVMGGAEVLARLRRDHPRLPVILLTGHVATEDPEEGTHVEASAYLFKPVKIDELIHTMKQCVKDHVHG